jgi:hypothetical protein
VTTPVSTWAPAFSNANFPWLKDFPLDQVFGPRLDDGRFPCRLCEDFLSDIGPDFPVLTAHAKHHKFEYRQWRAEEERKRREQAAQMKMETA